LASRSGGRRRPTPASRHRPPRAADRMPQAPAPRPRLPTLPPRRSCAEPTWPTGPPDSTRRRCGRWPRPPAAPVGSPPGAGPSPPSPQAADGRDLQAPVAKDAGEIGPGALPMIRDAGIANRSLPATDWNRSHAAGHLPVPSLPAKAEDRPLAQHLPSRSTGRARAAKNAGAHSGYPSLLDVEAVSSTARPPVHEVAGRALSVGRRARDLPERPPRPSSCRLVASSAVLRVSWGNWVEHEAAGGGADGPRWVHTAEVVGSKPATPTLVRALVVRDD
jgi:hypothetical protein